MRAMVIALLGGLLLAPAARADKFDGPRMRRDLSIAEAVLTRLQGGEEMPFANPVRGVYLKDYGAVFLSAGRNRNLLVAVLEAQQEGVERKAAEGGDFALFKEQTTEFLQSYADAIAQVDDEERITVLSGDLGGAAGGWVPGRGRKMIRRIFGVPGDSGGPPPGPGGRPGFERPAAPPGAKGPKPNEEFLLRVEKELDAPVREPVVFEGSAKKADLRALHRGRIEVEEFRRRITWREHRPDAEAAKQVDLMAGMLDKALVGDGQPGWGSGYRCSGVYHEGLGAIFFVNLGFGKVFSALAPPRFDRSRPVLPQIEAVAGEQQEKFKRELIEVVAEYGHTLPLKAGEHLVVEVHSGGPEKMAIDLVLRVGRAELAAYHQGALTLEGLSQKVEFAE
ncbi:MAG: hypothetical protein IT369_03710 [Candidatus Latescibacteria bacterium]|nr:hypothetical protein [Candidatus Latescibacterota bacterium]